MKNTQVFGELIDYDDPIYHFNGYSSMKIRLGMNIFQPLPFGTYAPNDRLSVNWIDFVYQELPRLFCSFCHRLGHENQDCFDVLLLNNQHMLPQAPSPDPPQPDLHALGPFVEPEYDDDYYEEMIHNVDFEDPDWSDWGSNPLAPLHPLIKTSLLSHSSMEKGISKMVFTLIHLQTLPEPSLRLA